MVHVLNHMMAMLKYLVSKDGLPNPRGSLSAEIPSRVISQINREVAKTAKTSSVSTKRGSYKQ